LTPFKKHLRVKALCLRSDGGQLVGAVRLQLARVNVVTQVGLEDFIAQILAQTSDRSRTDNLDAAIEIFGASSQRCLLKLFVGAIAKIEACGYVRETADQAANADVFPKARHTGTQHADPAHNQIDLNAGRRRFVQRLDNVCVGQAV